MVKLLILMGYVNSYLVVSLRFFRSVVSRQRTKANKKGDCEVAFEVVLQ